MLLQILDVSTDRTNNTVIIILNRYGLFTAIFISSSFLNRIGHYFRFFIFFQGLFLLYRQFLVPFPFCCWLYNKCIYFNISDWPTIIYSTFPITRRTTMLHNVWKIRRFGMLSKRTTFNQRSNDAEWHEKNKNKYDIHLDFFYWDQTEHASVRKTFKNTIWNYGFNSFIVTCKLSLSRKVVQRTTKPCVFYHTTSPYQLIRHQIFA